MKLILLSVLSALALAACGQAERDAKLKQLPGYQAAAATCSQCHALPYAPDHPPVAWAPIVNRMEAMIQNTGRPLPDQATHDAIVQYFEAGAKL